MNMTIGSLSKIDINKIYQDYDLHIDISIESVMSILDINIKWQKIQLNWF